MTTSLGGPPILIAGAGPTGLVLALNLARRHVPFRLIDDSAGPGEHSRAMAVHARTLEFYEQLGLARDVIEAGVRVNGLHLREGRTSGGGREVLHASFANLGGGLSPYPFVLAYPQDDHERFLVTALQAAGGTVEWGRTLTGLTQTDDGVRAQVSRSDGSREVIDASYLCGCDGARSCAREAVGAGFPGGTYEQLFYVADVKIARGFERDLSVTLGKDILALMLPVRSTGMQRLIGLVPRALTDRADLTFEDIRGQVEPLLDVTVTSVNWFSTYRVHHRVADHFKIGRTFLLGDAAHVHSPAGGQGMNTGIGDAMNLGWKLADVVRGRAAVSILDSYEPERIAFARRLVATTDRGFRPLVAGGLGGALMRRVVAPIFFAVGTRFELTRHLLFRTISQTTIHYPDSPLSEGTAGRVHGGDRLPWAGRGGPDNFAALQSLDWQVHVYGVASAALRDACGQLNLALHAFEWSKPAADAGLGRDACYLIRPDGHVGLADASQDVDRLTAYVRRLALRWSPDASSSYPA